MGAPLHGSRVTAQYGEAMGAGNTVIPKQSVYKHSQNKLNYDRKRKSKDEVKAERQAANT